MQVTKAQAGKGHPATRTITANRHTRKAFQWTWTMLLKTTPCETMLRCPLSRKWSRQILSQTSPASNRTLASANPAFSHQGHHDWFGPLCNNASNFASCSSSFCLDSKPLHMWHGFPSSSFYANRHWLCLTFAWHTIPAPYPWNSAPFGWLVLRPHGLCGYHSQEEKNGNWYIS